MSLALDTKEPAGGDTGRPARPAKPGCVRVGGIVVLVLACLSDFIVLQSEEDAAYLWLHLSALVVGLAALLWPERRRPLWLTPQVRTAVPALAAAANVVILLVTQQGRLRPGPGDPAAVSAGDRSPYPPARLGAGLRAA